VDGLAASRDGGTLIAHLTVEGTKVRTRDTLIGFDALTGTVRWQWWPDPAIAGDNIKILPDVIIGYDQIRSDVYAAGALTDTVVAIDPVSGRQLWLRRGVWAPHVNCLYRDDDDHISVAADGELTVLSVFCVDTDQVEIRAVDRSGAVRWTQSSTPVTSGTTLGIVNHRVYAVTANAVVVDQETGHQIKVLDQATGRLRWAAPYDTDLDRVLAVDGSTMLIAYDPVAGDPSQLQLRDLATGALRPAPTGAPTDSFIEFTVRAWHGHVYLLANERRDHVTAVDIDMATGTVTATSQLPSPQPGNLFATPVGNSEALVMDQGYALFALDGEDGNLYDTAIALGPSKH
jgi:outer membrane protein assembly factor BamB